MATERTVIVSDIHGDFDSLLGVMNEHPDDRLFCLGDAVGRRNNDRTLQLLHDSHTPCVNGNHEVDIMHIYQVSDDWRRWVQGWPDYRVERDLLFTHTLIDENRRFLEIDSTLSARRMYDSGCFRLAFVGHSHSPGWWSWSGGDERPVWTHAGIETTLIPEHGRRYIVDVGSLGEPKRPTDPRYVCWDGHSVCWRGL
ncbi:MAG: metallophosphoesterase [Candidatus Eremiobacteraeota bacterium]|nr:metallophosphoesterase [Candidatus Eremiobacteraeota bacterium]